MPQGTKICKVCGKTYPYCRTNRPSGMFRWQDVACCPEHAQAYFSAVAEARGTADTGNNVSDSEAESQDDISELDEDYELYDATDLDEDDDDE